jgi:hypothetical protein
VARGDNNQVVYVDGDIPQLPLQLGQLLVDSSQMATGIPNLQQCTSQNPLVYVPLVGSDGIDVRWYGVVGNGVTNDTAAIQAAVNAAPSGSTLVFPFGMTPAMGQVVVSSKNLVIRAEGATFILVGDSAGWLVDGAVTFFRVYGGTSIGDGVNRDSDPSTAQTAWTFGNTAGSNVSDAKVFNHTAIDCNNGLKFADGRGSGGGKTLNCAAVACNFNNMVGQVGGMGYGVQGTQADGLVILGCIGEDCERHAFYVAEGKNYVVASNQVLGGGFGAVRGGIVVSRSANTVVSGNLVAGRNDVALVIDTDTQGLAPDNVCAGVTVTGFQSYDNAIGDIKIGTSDPATDGFPTDITISGVQIRTKAASTNHSILITSGKNIVLTGINVDSSLADAAQRVVSLSAEDGASYTDNVSITLDHVSIPASGAAISVAAALCTSTEKLTLRVNQSTGAGAEYEFGSGEDAVTNTSLWYRRSNGRSGRTYSSSGTNVVIPLGGITDLTLSASGATTIANFSGGREGDLINLFFTNGNSTLTNVNFYTPGAVNFTGTANDCMSMQYVNAAWRTLSVSLN